MAVDASSESTMSQSSDMTLAVEDRTVVTPIETGRRRHLLGMPREIQALIIGFVRLATAYSSRVAQHH